MGAISMAEMRDFPSERQRQEENDARRAREFELEQARIRRENRIREERLLVLTDKLILGCATTEDINYILSQLTAWKQVLFKIAASR